MARKYNRRDFLKAGVLGASAIALSGCKFPQPYNILEPYVIPPEEQLTGNYTWYASACRMCPAGCGIIAKVTNGRAIKLEGNPEHPLNQGRLCARGQAGVQLLYHPDRLQVPVTQGKRGSRGFKAIEWNSAINTLYDRLKSAGGNIAFLAGSQVSGHIFSIFQNLANAVKAPAPVVYDIHSAFAGANTFSNTSKSLLGNAEVPVYDLANADVVIAFGSDLLTSSTFYGVQYGEFRSQPLGKRGYLIVLEPRMSRMGVVADRWIPIRPGSEALVAQAIAASIATFSLGAKERVDMAKKLVSNVDVNAAAAASDIPVQNLVDLARQFASAQRPLAIPSGRVAGAPGGDQALSAIQSLNLISQSFNGIGGFSLPQAAPAPDLGLTAASSFADVQKLIDSMNGGQVKALLIYGANPVYDLPAKSGFADALAKVPFVASFATIVDETAVQSDLVFPDRTYLESWGYQASSTALGEPVITSQQPVVEPMYAIMSAGDIFLSLAKGFPAAIQALPWKTEMEHIQDTISRLPSGNIQGGNPDELFARFLQHGGWWPGKLGTPPAAGTAPALPAPAAQPALKPVEFQGDQNTYPFYLHIYENDMLGAGEGASLPWLQDSPETMTSMSWQTWVEINPQTALKIGVKDGDNVKVTTPNGSIDAVVYTYPAIRPDTIAVPTGQGHTDYGRYAQNRWSNPINLVGALSGGVLAWNNLRAKIEHTPGKRTWMSIFEYKEGVQQGFINQKLPGR